jgi:hypothetical protein
MEVVAARTFNTLYIYLDLIWVVIYALFLISFKRYRALIVGLIAGVIYFLVDYGIFYWALNTRLIEGADPFVFLLWLSMSYGFTNFAWIWLLLERDGNSVEWSMLTLLGWIGVAFLSQSYGSAFGTISISRGTSSYHGAMALILVVGYLYLIARNLQAQKRGEQKVNLLWLLAIGIGVQLSWEFVPSLAAFAPPPSCPCLSTPSSKPI